MFFTTDKMDHGLAYNPFKAIVAPRPIAWVSTVDAEGRANLAPYSFFNAVSDTPPMVAFSSGAAKLGSNEVKDSPANIAATGGFCVNLVSHDLRDAMNATSAHLPHGVDEFDAAGLEKGASRIVSAPYVAAAPAVLECEHYQTLTLPGGNLLVMGQVLVIHIKDEILKDGRVDMALYQPLARLGYKDYTTVRDVFELSRPET